MEREIICIPGEPPLCAVLSYAPRPVPASGVFVDDDDPLLDSTDLLQSLKAEAQPGCLLCLLDDLEEED